MKEIFKKYYPLVFLLLFGAVILLYARFSVKEEYGYQIYWEANNSYPMQLKDGEVYEAGFIAPRDMKLTGIMIDLVCDHYITEPGRVRIEVTDQSNRKVIGYGEIVASQIDVFGWQDFVFPSYDLQSGDEVEVKLTAVDFFGDDTVSIAMSMDQITPALRIRTNILDALQKVQIVISVALLMWLVVAYILLFQTGTHPGLVLLVDFLLFFGCVMALLPEHGIYEAYYAALRAGGASVFNLATLGNAIARIPLFLWSMVMIDGAIGFASFIPALVIDDRRQLRRQAVMGATFLLIPLVTALFVFL